ncbi:hypothetical protein [Streptomyces sp. NPDC017086]|uniref:hypothetical protein n=1 Tax=Streptomyces sp. NPDC017086 TaxID=3364976 RepID=UPI00379A436C
MSRLTKRPRVDHKAAARALREQPGVWLVVGDYRSKTSADSTVTRIRHGYPIGAREYGTPYLPVGAYEARTEPVEDGTRVHARYIGGAA